MKEELNSQESEMNQENNNQPASENSNEAFESDTQKIVRRHLEDEDHVISDEEMQNIRVGMNPPNAGAKTLEQLNDDEAIRRAEQEIIGDPDKIKDSDNDKDERITPWDTINPS